jgi:hypothetical protein
LVSQILLSYNCRRCRRGGPPAGAAARWDAPTFPAYRNYRGLGALSVFLATHRGLLAVTAVIYSLYPAGTIILARVLSHERLTKVGMFGLCLASASVSLIAAGAVR